MNVFCVGLITFPTQKNMDSRLTDDAHFVKIVSRHNYITALNFSKMDVVLIHKLIHVYTIQA